MRMAALTSLTVLTKAGMRRSDAADAFSPTRVGAGLVELRCSAEVIVKATQNMDATWTKWTVSFDEKVGKMQRKRRQVFKETVRKLRK